MSSERPESAIPSSTPPSAATAAGPPDQGAPYPKRWKALAVLVVSLIIVVLDNTVLNVALKTIQDDLHATQDQLIWSINSYSLVFAALLFTWGVLGDRYGRRRILMIGLVLFALASALCAFAKSPEQLIAFRALMGIGGASVLPVTLSIITVIFPPQERGKAIGAWAAAVGGAVALGPLLGGFLLEHPEWFSSLIGNNFGSVFLINVPIIIAGLIGIVMVVPESKNPHPGRLDPVGLVLSVIGMLSLTTAKSGALIGVFISVTTIPAASNVGVALVFGAWSEAWGSLTQLGVNILGIQVAAGLTLLAQRRWMQPHRTVTRGLSAFGSGESGV